MADEMKNGDIAYEVLRRGRCPRLISMLTEAGNACRGMVTLFSVASIPDLNQSNPEFTRPTRESVRPLTNTQSALQHSIPRRFVP